MEEIANLSKKGCDECDSRASNKINTSSGQSIYLCEPCTQELVQDVQQRLDKKYDGMSEEEIADDLAGDLL